MQPPLPFVTYELEAHPLEAPERPLLISTRMTLTTKHRATLTRLSTSDPPAAAFPQAFSAPLSPPLRALQVKELESMHLSSNLNRPATPRLPVLQLQTASKEHLPDPLATLSPSEPKSQ